MPYNKYGRYEQSKEEKALNEKLYALVAKNTPPGTRVGFSDEVREGRFLFIRFFCSGAIPLQAYDCGLDVGHEGKCHSYNKDVDFTPDRGTKGRKKQ
jgi:hypothetical protein